MIWVLIYRFPFGRHSLWENSPTSLYHTVYGDELLSWLEDCCSQCPLGVCSCSEGKRIFKNLILAPFFIFYFISSFSDARCNQYLSGMAALSPRAQRYLRRMRRFRPRPRKVVITVQSKRNNSHHQGPPPPPPGSSSSIRHTELKERRRRAGKAIKTIVKN